MMILNKNGGKKKKICNLKVLLDRIGVKRQIANEAASN